MTMENLEQKINEALANEMTHNFALSIKGEVIKDDNLYRGHPTPQ